MSERIRSLATRVRNNKPESRLSKANRTHTLTEPNYTIFASYVRSRGMAVQNVLDELIVSFLEEVRDDLSEADRNTIHGLNKAG